MSWTRLLNAPTESADDPIVAPRCAVSSANFSVVPSASLMRFMLMTTAAAVATMGKNSEPMNANDAAAARARSVMPPKATPVPAPIWARRYSGSDAAADDFPMLSMASVAPVTSLVTTFIPTPAAPAVCNCFIWSAIDFIVKSALTRPGASIGMVTGVASISLSALTWSITGDASSDAVMRKFSSSAMQRLSQQLFGELDHLGPPVVHTSGPRELGRHAYRPGGPRHPLAFDEEMFASFAITADAHRMGHGAE